MKKIILIVAIALFSPLSDAHHGNGGGYRGGGYRPQFYQPPVRYYYPYRRRGYYQPYYYPQPAVIVAPQRFFRD